MIQPHPVTIDFETFGIEDRPYYPPKPVGVSIKYPRKRPQYYAFGHPTKNNSTRAAAREAVAKAYQHRDGILCQNAKFDIDVAATHFNLPVPEWTHIHDTQFLLFLDDPHQTELGLKPSAERLLHLPPDEQNAVADWLVEHQPIPHVKISRARSSEHYFGRYIAYAPGDLVGTYANGDVVRTEALFDLLWEKTYTRQMGVAYDRERRLMPILLGMEQRGVPVDLARLRTDAANYERYQQSIDTWIRKTLRVGTSVNLDSGSQLVEAMVAAGKARRDLFPLTAKGHIQTNKEAMLAGVTDKILLAMLKYRTQLGTCMGTFLLPWLQMAEQSNGLIYTTWNQIKAPSGDANVGTRTGRLSSTPNFQNIPKVFQPIFHHDDPTKSLPRSPLRGLPPLPKMRSYIIPFPGHVLIDRDYSQQEPRILAHFDGGSLMRKYIDDPWIDFHDYARAELEKMGKFYERKPVKNTNLGLIYGMGVGKLAMKNAMSVQEAGELKKAILLLYPGLKAMYQDMKVRAKQQQPIRTWGGREYYCEPPRLVEGRIREFDYKLVNVLIQGSAADCTKDAIIQHHTAKHTETQLILNVHDQLTASTPKKLLASEMEVLRVAMESVQFDVPMLSEGAISTTNWDALVDYDKKGRRV